MKRMKCMLVGMGIILVGLGSALAQDEYAKLSLQDEAVMDSALSSEQNPMDIWAEAMEKADALYGSEDASPLSVVEMGIAWGGLVLIILLVQLFKYLNRKKRLEVAESAILHGQELPQEFFDEGKPRRSFLQRGITQIAVGVGLMVACGVSIHWNLAVWGLVVVALGVGNVLAYFLGRKEKKADGQ